MPASLLPSTGDRPIHSRDHLLISLAAGAVVGVIVPQPAPLVVGYAAALGVGIDLDHFEIARLNTGDWRALRGLLDNPRRVVIQSALFAPARSTRPSGCSYCRT